MLTPDADGRAEVVLLDFVREHSATRRVSASYIAQLETTVRSFSRYLGYPATSADLYAEKVNGWLQSMRDTGLSLNTHWCRRKMLLCAWEALALVHGDVLPPHREEITDIKKSAARSSVIARSRTSTVGDNAANNASTSNGNGVMLLRDFLAVYALQRDLTTAYVKQLHWCLVSWCKFLSREPDLNDLCCDSLNTWLAAMRVEGLASATRRSRRRMVLAMWEVAAIEGHVSQPHRKRIANPKIAERVNVAWRQSEVEQLLASTERLRGWCGQHNIRKNAYWSSFVRASWDLGLRGCDMRLLRRDQISPDGTVVLIQIKTGRRVVGRVRKSTLAAINRTFGPDRILVWPLYCTLSSWRRRANLLITRAGLQGSIGRLRHSSGTAVEIQNPGCGHTFLGNTRQIFEQHYLDQTLARVNRPLPPELKSKGHNDAARMRQNEEADDGEVDAMAWL